LIDGRTVAAGDLLVGLPSTGLHTNGYSLARRIAFEKLRLEASSHVPELGTTVGDALLAPHRSYLPALRPLLASGVIAGMAHITGGGITDNLPRILPDGVGARIETSAWDVPPVFRWLERAGEVPVADMYRTFNMGIGLILVVSRQDADSVLSHLREARVIGELEAGEKRVVYG
jgi:phosphoribosylformylglycinamidine cyclo-ligase